VKLRRCEMLGSAGWWGGKGMGESEEILGWVGFGSSRIRRELGRGTVPPEAGHATCNQTEPNPAKTKARNQEGRRSNATRLCRRISYAFIVVFSLLHSPLQHTVCCIHLAILFSKGTVFYILGLEIQCFFSPCKQQDLSLFW